MTDRSLFDAIQEAAAEHFAEVLTTDDESDDADLIALRAMLSKAAFDRGRAIIENESRTASFRLKRCQFLLDFPDPIAARLLREPAGLEGPEVAVDRLPALLDAFLDSTKLALVLRVNDPSGRLEGRKNGTAARGWQAFVLVQAEVGRSAEVAGAVGQGAVHVMEQPVESANGWLATPGDRRRSPFCVRFAHRQKARGDPSSGRLVAAA